MRISDWSSDVCSSDLLAARLQGFQRVGQCLAGSNRYQNTVLTAGHVAGLHHVVTIEDRSQDAATGGQGQELVTETDQATSRDVVLKAHTALAIRNHVGQDRKSTRLNSSH